MLSLVVSLVWLASFFLPNLVIALNIQLWCILCLFIIIEILVAKKDGDKSLLNTLPSIVCILLSLFVLDFTKHILHTKITGSDLDISNTLMISVIFFYVMSVVACCKPLLKKNTLFFIEGFFIFFMECLFEWWAPNFNEFAVANITLLMYIRFILNDKYWQFFWIKPSPTERIQEKESDLMIFLSYLLTFGFTLTKVPFLRNCFLGLFSLITGPVWKRSYYANLHPHLKFVRGYKYFKTLTLKTNAVLFLLTILTQVFIQSAITYFVSYEAIKLLLLNKQVFQKWKKTDNNEKHTPCCHPWSKKEPPNRGFF